MLSKLLSAAKGLPAALRGDTPTATTTLPAIHSVEQLHRLNGDFLHLLCQINMDRQERWAMALHLPSDQHHCLQHTDAGALTRMAQCDFALFSACFSQPDVWLRLHGLCTRLTAQDRYAPAAAIEPVHQAASTLFEAVLFFAWHLAQQDMNAARMLLGMADDSMQIIRRLDIWQCQWLARQHSHLLGIRWRSSSYFWADLLRYGQSNDDQLMRIVRTLSTQLTAQDLEPSAVARLTRSDAT